jgi:hypothetical protein
MYAYPFFGALILDKTKGFALSPLWLTRNAVLPSLTNSKRSLKNTIFR